MGIVDISSPIIDVYDVVIRHKIPVEMSVSESSMWKKYPVPCRNHDVYTNIHPRSQGSPTIVSTAISPAYPSGAPLITGNPSPTIEI
jgi:hypothetical protein